MMVFVENSSPINGYVDLKKRTIALPNVSATNQEGNLVAVMDLVGTLVNMQPSAAISHTPGSAWDLVVLTALSTDPEDDPLTHRWMIPGVGSLSGDTVITRLPEGKHAVILYADDPLRARDVTATWIEILQPIP
jgi:hypothetical protein